MKKVEVEKLVSKSIIITAILLCLILGTTFIQTGYFNALTFATTSKATVAVSIIFAAVAVLMVGLGIFKNSKYYVYATGAAVVAIFVMLLKINYEIKALQFNIGTATVKFYMMAIAICCVAILATWIRATVKLIKE